MGVCAEETAQEYGITREMQDAHAIESYQRAAAAWKAGWFKNEIVPVTMKDKKGDKVVSEDEEYKNIKFDKVATLKGAFVKNGEAWILFCFFKVIFFLNTSGGFFLKKGTVTAANSSTLNDGASALVLMTRQEAESRNLKPLARILSYADAATAPKKFTIAPSLSLPLALQKAGLSVSDISLFEINEAFSVVVRANEKVSGGVLYSLASSFMMILTHSAPLFSFFLLLLLL
jgi:acetyl-CoA C-acetyltransferase